ncbi:hypothetical protein [Rhizobium leucaenae]|uniref:hypothetical protein n=1 Tax=Rhizobium leucaenae TaxID=29450 RepID=UPI000402840B|nr:hypothetical protein [Rhizobium leucaenae]
MTGNEIVELAIVEFDAWVAAQSDEVQELDVIRQAELYANANDNVPAEQRRAA